MGTSGLHRSRWADERRRKSEGNKKVDDHDDEIHFSDNESGAFGF